MNKYGSYKNSGVDWIGEIPKHWDCVRLKNIVEEPLKYGANESADDDNPDNPRYIRITDFGADGNLKNDTFKSLPDNIANDYLLKQGDLLFARSGATVGKTFHFKNYNGRACYAGYLIKASFDKEKINSSYINYLTRSNYYNNWIQSIFQQATIQNIGANKYNLLKIPIPTDVEEQNIIANYLDQKTTEIDNLISKKERLIELLEEEKTAVINEAVTKGLDPDVRMKDSGVEWLGEIPENWLVKKVVSISDSITGFAFKSAEYSFDGGVKLVRGDNVTEGRLRWGDKTRRWSNPGQELERFYLQPNDIVIGMDGSKVGKNFALVQEKELPLLLVQRVARVRAYNDLYARLISQSISSYNFKYYINKSKTDPAVPHITLKNIRDFKLVLPPTLEELEELLNLIEENIKDLDSTINRVRKEVELLSEYKKALISEVVTGKVDVRDEVLVN